MHGKMSNHENEKCFLVPGSLEAIPHSHSHRHQLQFIIESLTWLCGHFRGTFVIPGFVNIEG
jgi:hypothetical protein